MDAILAKIKADSEAITAQASTLGILDCRACGQTAHWCDCATRQPWAI